MTPRSSPDLTDAQWGLIEPFFPAVSREDGRNGRPRKYPYRAILNGIFYLLRAGCAWDLLPRDFPPHATCYHYFSVWSETGLLEKVHTALREKERPSPEREPTPSAAILDSPSVKTTEKGGSPGRTRLATMATKRERDVSVTCS